MCFWNRVSVIFHGVFKLNLWRKELKIIPIVFINPWWSIWISTLSLLRRTYLSETDVLMKHFLRWVWLLLYKKATHTSLVFFNIFLYYNIDPGLLCSLLKSSSVFQPLHMLKRNNNILFLCLDTVNNNLFSCLDFFGRSVVIYSV